MILPPKSVLPIAVSLATIEKKLMNVRISCIRPDPAQPRKEFDERRIDEMSKNLASIGQLCPVIGFPWPDDPTVLILVDGERRLHAARRVPLETLEAIVLPSSPSPAELLLTQLTLGQMRDKLTAQEQANAYTKLMAEFGFTQQQLAEKLGVSATKVSNVFAVRRLLPELQPLATSLEPSIVPIIARLASSEQTVVMNYATKVGEDMKRPSRDEVMKFIASRAPSRPSRAKSFAGEFEGRKVRVDIRPEDTHDTIVEYFKALITMILKHKNVPISKLMIVLNGMTRG